MLFAKEISQEFKKNGCSKKLIDNFQEIIWSYYRSHERSLPWRTTDNPYRIFVSEMMLQQTQAERVVVKYNSFLKKYPTFKSLAESKIEDVLRLWQGLGYNRRALWMRDAAIRVYGEYGGKLPQDPAILESFKGIGHATAREMAIFSYGIVDAFIETNIRRVFLYFFYPNSDNVNDKILMPLIEKCVDKTNPREWYYALMDYGVMLKKKFPKKNPNKKSKQYKKQSKFEGSNRQMRGIILRTLMENSETGISLAAFKKIILTKWIAQHNLAEGDNEHLIKQIERNINQMEKERFISVNEGKIGVAK